MIKHVLLLSSMLVALPVLAAQQPASEQTQACQSIKDLSALTMGTFYSIPPTSVRVEIQRLSKPENISDVLSIVNTSYKDQNCIIEWVTPVSGCMSQLRSLYCTSLKERQELQAHLERLEKVMWTAQPILETKKAEPVDE
ncbi:hypothetical protein V0M98_33345 (plasmid) [Pseudomonas silesiensis]|uniref:hypothetical protein n=1 Tax=Pseudomonas silesiensis TaxID=1853130 RepID=UPI0030CC5F39